MQGLWWLPDPKTCGDDLGASQSAADLVRTARQRLDFVETASLDRVLRRVRQSKPDALPTIRLAILASTTIEHLLPGLRIAALRRGLFLEVYVPPFGQYRQALWDDASALSVFKPDVVVFAFDFRHLLGSTPDFDLPGALDTAVRDVSALWRRTKQRFAAQIIQQTIMPTATPFLGENDHRLEWSAASGITQLNARLRAEAMKQGVDILSLDRWLTAAGLDYWFDPVLWHAAKQEIRPAAAPLFGDIVLRVIAAGRGLSAKCLVLDLDNTLWGGVVADDDVQGIALGQGSAVGEAFLQFQHYLKALCARGVILALCSKNDVDVAMAALTHHPEMALRPQDIAAYRINWTDKASNIRAIANELEIATSAVVFVDDNPFERNLVRAQLPEVMVPEMPDDPSLYARCLADSGFLECLHVSAEDRNRTRLYAARAQAASVREDAADLSSYLVSLDMTLSWSPFQSLDIGRITQLANKTNQFNLTGRRYAEAELDEVTRRSDMLTVQARLSDRFGEHGLICGLVARFVTQAELEIEAWFMSCRVLGRGVESAVAGILLEAAEARGARVVRGRYVDTGRNGIVRDHYQRLGFVAEACDSAAVWWRLEPSSSRPSALGIKIVRV